MESRKLFELLTSRENNRELGFLSSRNKSRLVIKIDNSKRMYVRKSSQKVYKDIPKLNTVLDKKNLELPQGLVIVGSRENIKDKYKDFKHKIPVFVRYIKPKKFSRPISCSPLSSKKPLREPIKINLNFAPDDQMSDAEDSIMESKLK